MAETSKVGTTLNDDLFKLKGNDPRDSTEAARLSCIICGPQREGALVRAASVVRVLPAPWAMSSPGSITKLMGKNLGSLRDAATSGARRAVGGRGKRSSMHKSMTASRRRARTSVLLNNGWDQNASFSIEVEISSAGRAELVEALKSHGSRSLNERVSGGCRGRMMLSTAQLRETALGLGLTRIKLSGLRALRYRAGVVVQYLARLEAPSSAASLDTLALCRRTQWHMVAKAPRGSEITVGAIVSAVDGESAMLASYSRTRRVPFRRRRLESPRRRYHRFEQTRDALAKGPKYITFRRAPFHQGWARVESEDEAGRVARETGVLFIRYDPPRRDLRLQ